MIRYWLHQIVIQTTVVCIFAFAALIVGDAMGVRVSVFDLLGASAAVGLVAVVGLGVDRIVRGKV